MSHDRTNVSGKKAGNISRRRAVKTIVGGVVTIAAYQTLPVRWEKPSIDAIFVPAHAQTSGVVEDQPPAPVTFSLTVTATREENDACTLAGIYVSIQGVVTASDGRDMTGAEIEITFTDGVSTGTVAPSPTVAAGNIYSWAGLMVLGGGWSSANYEITAAFVDQAAYGTASATTSGSC